MKNLARWRLGALASAIALLGSVASLEAHALALGRITVQSALGEPLRAEIDIAEINAEEAASLRAGPASADAFRAAGLEYTTAVVELQVSLQRRADGRPYLRLSSNRPVNEPFVDLILEANWSSGRIVRDYTMLFDPPSLRRGGQATAVAPTAPVLSRPQPSFSTPAAPPATPPQAMAIGGMANTSPAPAAPPPRPASVARATPSPAPAAIAVPPRGGTGATSGQQVTVRAGDTAGKIAAQNKPASVSLDQMLVALLRSNPDAFIGGNINRLKSGAVLGIPSAEEASALSTEESSRTIVAQAKDFNDFRRKFAQNVPAAQVAAANRQAGGQVQAKVEDRTPAAATPDKLTLSKGSVQGKPANEDAIAKQRQATEASSRVAELSKNIDDLNRIAGAPVGTAGRTPAVPAPQGSGAATPARGASSPAGATPGVTVAASPPVVAIPAATAAPQAAATPAGPASATPAARPALPTASSLAVAAPAGSAASAAARSAASATPAAASATTVMSPVLPAPSVLVGSSTNAAATPVSTAAGSATSTTAALSAASAPASLTSGTAGAPVSSLPSPSASAPAPAVVQSPVAAPVSLPAPTLLDELTANPFLLPGLAAILLALAAFAAYRFRQRSNPAQVDSSFLESRLQPDSFFGASGGQRIDTSEGGATGSSLVYSPSQLDAAGDVDPVAEADVYLAYGRDLQAEEILKEAMRTNPSRVAIHAKLMEIYAKRRDVRAFEVVALEAFNLTRGEGPEWAYIGEMGRELDPTNAMYQPGGHPTGGTPESAKPAPSAYDVASGSFASSTLPQSIEPEFAESDGPVDFDLDLDFSIDDPAPAPAAHTPAPMTAAVAAYQAPAPEPAAPKKPGPAEPMFEGLDMDFGTGTMALKPAEQAPAYQEPLSLDLDAPDPALAASGLTFTSEPFAKPAAAPVPTPPKAAAVMDSGMLEFDMGSLSLELDEPATGNAVAPAVAPAAASADNPLETKFFLAEEFRALGDLDGARSLAEEVVAEADGSLKTKAQAFLNALS